MAYGIPVVCGQTASMHLPEFLIPRFFIQAWQPSPVCYAGFPKQLPWKLTFSTRDFSSADAYCKDFHPSGTERYTHLLGTVNGHFCTDCPSITKQRKRSSRWSTEAYLWRRAQQRAAVATRRDGHYERTAHTGPSLSIVRCTANITLS